MSHPCQFNVYLRERGQQKRTMLASFASFTDCVNFAAEKSRGQFNSPTQTLLALGMDRKVAYKFRQGKRV